MTGDENIIHVRGTLLYRIAEPGLRYTFDFVATSNLVQNAFNNALLYAAAGFKVDDALRRDVAGFRDRVRARVERLITEEQLGIIVDQITLSAIPPRQLKKAFDAVNEAEVRRSTVINEARAYENQTISRAKAGGSFLHWPPLPSQQTPRGEASVSTQVKFSGQVLSWPTVQIRLLTS